MLDEDIFVNVSTRVDTIRTCLIRFIKKIPHWITKYSHSVQEFKSSDNDVHKRIVHEGIIDTIKILNFVGIEHELDTTDALPFSVCYFSKERVLMNT